MAEIVGVCYPPCVAYWLTIGLRYLGAKKRKTVSVITTIAIIGVALGVAALLSVRSITSGFQKQFQEKVLGVNAHVLVLKYGLDFKEYRDVMGNATKDKRVAGAAPFRIDEMMLAKEGRVSGVLVKGVDPEALRDVLDLPRHLVEGSLMGLRLKGSEPPINPEDLEVEPLGERDFGNLLDEIVAQNSDSSKNDGGKGEPGSQKPVEQGQEEVTANALGVRLPSPDQAEAAMQQDEAQDLSPEDEDLLMAELELEADDPEKIRPGIIIGRTLAKNVGVGLGDEVTLYSPMSGMDTSMWRADGGAPSAQPFVITGIFEAGFQEYDSRLVYIDLYEAQRFFDQGDTVTGVEIRLNRMQEAHGVARDLERKLGASPYHTLDWRELNHNLFTALEIQKAALTLVIATIVFVAAFNVIATLIMIVLEKKREIAILKAMGARNRNILSIFAAQGLVIGLIGTLLGLALGGAVCFYLQQFKFPLDPKVYLIDHLPVVISWAEFAWTFVIALLICGVATLLPSWWAARIIPSQGLRYE